MSFYERSLEVVIDPARELWDKNQRSKYSNRWLAIETLAIIIYKYYASCFARYQLEKNSHTPIALRVTSANIIWRFVS